MNQQLIAGGAGRKLEDHVRAGKWLRRSRRYFRAGPRGAIKDFELNAGTDVANPPAIISGLEFAELTVKELVVVDGNIGLTAERQRLSRPKNTDVIAKVDDETVVRQKPFYIQRFAHRYSNSFGVTPWVREAIARPMPIRSEFERT